MDEPTLKLHKIFYDEDSRAAIGLGYIPLDNRGGDRDWFELLPILKWLETHDLEDGIWYGFLSPKFPEKALLTRADVEGVIRRNPDCDVALFTYNWPWLALSENTWVRGELFHPGLIACFERFLRSRGADVDLRSVVSDFDTSLYSNYVVARRPFWEAWRGLARAYVDYVEAGGPDLPDNAPTGHMGVEGYRLRTFVQEQLVCWLLITRPFRIARPDYARDVSLDHLTPGRDSWLLRALLRGADRSKSMTRRTGWRGFLIGFKLCRRLALRLARFRHSYGTRPDRAGV